MTSQINSTAKPEVPLPSFFNLYPLCALKRQPTTSLPKPIFELHVNGISLHSHTNGFFLSISIVRIIHATAYRYSSFTAAYYSLLMNIAQFIILPSPLLRVIFIVSSWELTLLWAFLPTLPTTLHPPAPQLVTPPLYSSKGITLLSLTTSIHIYIYG